MMRVSNLGDYALVVMTCLARVPQGGAATARQVAASSRLPPATVSKVLKALARAGLLLSQRGKGGGYVLARSPADISVAAVVAAIDGPVGLTDCANGAPTSCDLEAACPCRATWSRINETIRSALEGVSLQSLAPPVDPIVPFEANPFRRSRKRERLSQDPCRGAGEVKP